MNGRKESCAPFRDRLVAVSEMGDVGKESVDEGGIGGGLFDKGQVARAADQVEAGAGDQVGEVAGEVGWGGAILGACDDHGGKAEGAGGVVEIGMGDGLGSAKPALRGAGQQAVLPRPVALFGAEGAGEPAFHRGGGNGGKAALFDLGDAALPKRGSAQAVGSVRQDEAADEIEALRQAVDADPAVQITIDLVGKRVKSSAGHDFALSIPESARDALVAGRWDPIQELLDRESQIDATAKALHYV